MERRPSGWSILADEVYARLAGVERVYRLLLGGFVVLALMAPLDNVLELPHGAFLWSVGAERPFSEWRRDYDRVAAEKTPQARNERGLVLRALPPLTALPGIGFYWMLAFTGIFLAGQRWFFPTARGVSIAAPVFGLFAGGLTGSALLLFLEFSGSLQRMDRRFRLAAENGGWIGRLSALFGGWQNRPWIHIVVFVAAAIAGIAALRLLRRDPERGRFHLLSILFMGAAAESLAGFAVDLATRIRQPTAFLTGTFVTLLIAVPMTIWAPAPLLRAWRERRQAEVPTP